MTHSKSAAATVRYLLGKSGAVLLDATVPGTAVKQIQLGFNLMMRLNDRVEVEALHYSLSLNPSQSLSNETAGELVFAFRDELAKRGIDSENHPYIAVRHTDVPHEHVHLLISRVGYDGTLIPLDFTFLKARDAAAAVADRLDWVEPTPNRRSLWFDPSHLEWMAENQKPTSRLQRWAENIGCDLTEWDVQQWREFADRPGVVLTRIERQLERDRPFRAIALQPEQEPASQKREPEPQHSPASQQQPFAVAASLIVDYLNWLGSHRHRHKKGHLFAWDSDTQTLIWEDETNQTILSAQWDGRAWRDRGSQIAPERVDWLQREISSSAKRNQQLQP